MNYCPNTLLGSIEIMNITLGRKQKEKIMDYKGYTMSCQKQERKALSMYARMAGTRS